MEKINLSEDIKQQEKEAGIGSDIFKIEEGANKIRLISKPVLHQGEYKGKPTYKYVCHVLDRKDGVIKPAFLAKKIIQQITALQNSDEYAFEGLPMPYDITLNAVNAGTIDVKYSIIPAKNEVPLTKEEEQDISELKPIEEFLEKLNKKQARQEKSFDDDLSDGVEEVTPEDIPF